MEDGITLDHADGIYGPNDQIVITIVDSTRKKDSVFDWNTFNSLNVPFSIVAAGTYSDRAGLATWELTSDDGTTAIVTGTPIGQPAAPAVDPAPVDGVPVAA